MENNDVSVMLPVELLESLSKAIEVGIQRAKMPTEDRKQLDAWWEAEKDFLNDHIPNR